MPSRVGQNCEFCGSPALVDYQEIKAPIRPQSLLPFKVTESAGPREHPPLVREQVVCAGHAEEPRARRHGARPLHPLLDLRRAGALPVGGRGRALLLHDRDLSRQPGPHSRRGRCGTCGGSPPPASSTTSSTTSRCRARRASTSDLLRQVRAVPDDGSRALRHRVPLRLRRRALPGRADRRGEAVAGPDAPAARGAVRRAGARRHVPQPAHRARVSRAQTFKHILVPVWLLAYTYGAKRYQVVVNGYTGGDCGPVPEEPVEDSVRHAARARCGTVILYASQ